MGGQTAGLSAQTAVWYPSTVGDIKLDSLLQS